MFIVQHGYGTDPVEFVDREDAVKFATALAEAYRTGPITLAEDGLWPVVLDEAGARIFSPARVA